MSERKLYSIQHWHRFFEIIRQTDGTKCIVTAKHVVSFVHNGIEQVKHIFIESQIGMMSLQNGLTR